MNRLRIFLLKLAEINFLEAERTYKAQLEALSIIPDFEFTLWFEGSFVAAAWFELLGTILYGLATIGIKKP